MTSDPWMLWAWLWVGLLALMCLAGDDTLRPWLERTAGAGERALVDQVRIGVEQTCQ